MDQHTKPGLYKTVVIKAIKEEVKGFKTFLLEADPVQPIRYRAGQYLTLVHPTRHEEVRRSYSFVSSPDLNEPLCIGVKRIENGFFSRKLIEEAKPGDQLVTTGAAGRFILPENIQDYKQVFFLAAGSGITPIFSLLKTVLHRYPFLQAILIYSNASPEKAIFRQELEALQQQYPTQLQVEFLYSNNQNLSRARLYRELLETFLKTHITVPYRQALFYICGPEAYMRMCSYVLQEAQVPTDHIKKENFTIERIRPPRAAPPDTHPHQVFLQLGNKEYQFETHYPDTILQSAKKQGIVLPYSCEVGRCGNCLAQCTRGQVWHSYNEVLTDKELAAGMILTCVGYPIYGDVTLRIGAEEV